MLRDLDRLDDQIMTYTKISAATFKIETNDRILKFMSPSVSMTDLICISLGGITRKCPRTW